MAGASLTEQPRIFRALALLGQAATVNAAADYAMGLTDIQLPTNANAGRGAVDWRAGDWQVYLKPLYWRLRVQVRTSGPAAPGQDVYCTVYSCAPSGVTAGAVLLGTEIPNARGAVTQLALVTTTYELTTPTFAAPADGWYIPVLHSNAAWAATSGCNVQGALEVWSR